MIIVWNRKHHHCVKVHGDRSLERRENITKKPWLLYIRITTYFKWSVLFFALSYWYWHVVTCLTWSIYNVSNRKWTNLKIHGGFRQRNNGLGNCICPWRDLSASVRFARVLKFFHLIRRSLAVLYTVKRSGGKKYKSSKTCFSRSIWLEFWVFFFASKRFPSVHLLICQTRQQLIASLCAFG